MIEEVKEKVVVEEVNQKTEEVKVVEEEGKFEII